MLLKPEAAGRQIIYHSFLYYGLDINEIKDAEFDKLCVFAADNWDALSDDMKKKLGSAEKLRASGYHCLMSQQDLYAAAEKLRRPILIPPNHLNAFIKKPGHLMPVSVRCFLR
ncbi:DNA ligase LigA-related protein [Aestuariivirga sp.]|uniref:DNA ligase LigA-related protein n=1 Tax=Aestuariivirga sp. TaxID=2650926 RepID=UPI0039E2E95A